MMNITDIHCAVSPLWPDGWKTGGSLSSVITLLLQGSTHHSPHQTLSVLLLTFTTTTNLTTPDQSLTLSRVECDDSTWIRTSGHFIRPPHHSYLSESSVIHHYNNSHRNILDFRAPTLFPFFPANIFYKKCIPIFQLLEIEQ